jgi:hypothetical protein
LPYSRFDGRCPAAALYAADAHPRLRLIASSVADSADDLQLAFDTSDLAADLALAYFESGVSATLKADGTPVTEADRRTGSPKQTGERCPRSSGPM